MDESSDNSLELTAKVVSAWLKRRVPSSHKGSFGKLQVIAGSTLYPGAAVLSCLGAFKAGAGYVYLHSEASKEALLALPELILGKCFEAKVCLLGPGLSSLGSLEGLAEDLNARILKQPHLRIVLDASALTLEFMSKISQIQGISVVATPHPGEAAKLLDISVMDLQKNRIEAVRKLQSCFPFVNVWVLKGPQTLIANSDLVFMNTSGSQAMASAGQGDVLSGIIAAFLLEQESLIQAVASAVFVHGMAADVLSNNGKTDRGVLAHEVANVLPTVLAKLLESQEP